MLIFSFQTFLGGGWTLVVSISSSSNDHLLRREVNCYLPTRCVEFVTSAVPCRKLSDEDIHEIATHEGIYTIRIYTSQLKTKAVVFETPILWPRTFICFHLSRTKQNLSILSCRQLLSLMDYSLL